MAKNSNKKYYWLKLKENFFEDDTIQFIEEQENGKDYVIFYLKLCLKSLTKNGKLFRLVGNKLMPYDVKSLARLTNTHTDTVNTAMNLFKELGIVEVLDSGELYISQINEMIGAETNKAQLMREKRAREKAFKIEGGNNVTGMLPHIDIDKDIDKDIDIEIKLEKEKTKRFKKPTILELKEYCNEKGFKIDVERFYDYYESKGWKVGKSSMKDWKSAIRNWNRNNYSNTNPSMQINRSRDFNSKLSEEQRKIYNAKR